MAGIKRLPPNSFGSEQERRNAAATLAFECKVSGLTQVDHVVLSTNGSGIFAMQGRLDDPAHHRIHVDKAQAASQPIEMSTQQIDQERQSLPRSTNQREQKGASLA